MRDRVPAIGADDEIGMNFALALRRLCAHAGDAAVCKNKIDNWVAPKYWAEVEYRDITTDGLLRHTTFRGLYETKKAKKALVAKFK